MLQGLLSTGALVRVHCEQEGQEVQAALVRLRHALVQARALGMQVLIPMLHICQPASVHSVTLLADMPTTSTNQTTPRLADLRGSTAEPMNPHVKSSMGAPPLPWRLR